MFLGIKCYIIQAMNDICTNPSVNLFRIWIGIKLVLLVHVYYSAVDINVPEYEKKANLRKRCKTVKSEPKTDSDQAEGCRNNLSFWRGWKGNVKYLITLWKAKISVPPYLPLSTGLTDPDSPQSEQILTYIYKSDSINKFRSYNLSLSMCGPQGDYTRLFL